MSSSTLRSGVGAHKPVAPKAAARKAAAPKAAVPRKFTVLRNSSSGAFVKNLSLADPESAKALAAFRKEITSSPERARAWLNQVGILTPKGNLSRRYGGK